VNLGLLGSFSPSGIGLFCSSLVILLLSVSSSSAQWVQQVSGTESRLRGVSAVSDRVCWATGARGTVLRTTEGGATWQKKTVPGAGELDFRDVHAFENRTAYILSIGAGELSRIYKTTDGGTTWAASFRNNDPRGFLDAIAFWDEAHGIAQGDPVDGRFLILTTDDRGMSWHPDPPQGMPPALDGEGAFAASGTCLIVQGDRNAWFCTGGAKTARVFQSTDRGLSWIASNTPITAGSSSAGIFSLAFRDAGHGIAVGGDFKHPEQGGRVVARTGDGGRTWSLTRGHGPSAFRSAAVYVPGTSKPTLVAVGPSGADISDDDGETWKPLQGPGFHAVGCAGPGAGWAVGEGGQIARYQGELMRPR
jgi:photosystem II stability/assembly factor-like uncharacterized protein